MPKLDKWPHSGLLPVLCHHIRGQSPLSPCLRSDRVLRLCSPPPWPWQATIVSLGAQQRPLAGHPTHASFQSGPPDGGPSLAETLRAPRASASWVKDTFHRLASEVLNTCLFFLVTSFPATPGGQLASGSRRTEARPSPIALGGHPLAGILVQELLGMPESMEMRAVARESCAPQTKRAPLTRPRAENDRISKWLFQLPAYSHDGSWSHRGLGLKPDCTTI